MQIFKIKKNDTLPVLAIGLQYANGSAIDLTGAGSVFFRMGNSSTYAPYFSGACVVTGSTTGNIEYRWIGSPDTATTGLFWGEFTVAWTGSRVTLPSDHSFQVQVYEDYN